MRAQYNYFWNLGGSNRYKCGNATVNWSTSLPQIEMDSNSIISQTLGLTDFEATLRTLFWLEKESFVVWNRQNWFFRSKKLDQGPQPGAGTQLLPAVSPQSHWQVACTELHWGFQGKIWSEDQVQSLGSTVGREGSLAIQGSFLVDWPSLKFKNTAILCVLEKTSCFHQSNSKWYCRYKSLPFGLPGVIQFEIISFCCKSVRWSTLLSQMGSLFEPFWFQH